jgi:hypothetical protein
MPVAIEVIVPVAIMIVLHLGTSRRSPTRRLPIRGKRILLPQRIEPAAKLGNDDRNGVLFAPTHEIAQGGRIGKWAKY